MFCLNFYLIEPKVGCTGEILPTDPLSVRQVSGRQV